MLLVMSRPRLRLVLCLSIRGDEVCYSYMNDTLYRAATIGRILHGAAV